MGTKEIKENINSLLYEYCQFDKDEEAIIINSFIEELKISTIEELNKLNNILFSFEKDFFNSWPVTERLENRLVKDYTQILFSDFVKNNKNTDIVNNIKLSYNSIPKWKTYND